MAAAGDGGRAHPLFEKLLPPHSGVYDPQPHRDLGHVFRPTMSQYVFILFSVIFRLSSRPLGICAIDLRVSTFVVQNLYRIQTMLIGSTADAADVLELGFPIRVLVTVAHARQTTRAEVNSRIMI